MASFKIPKTNVQEVSTQIARQLEVMLKGSFWGEKESNQVRITTSSGLATCCLEAVDAVDRAVTDRYETRKKIAHAAAISSRKADDRVEQRKQAEWEAERKAFRDEIHHLQQRLRFTSEERDRSRDRASKAEMDLSTLHLAVQGSSSGRSRSTSGENDQDRIRRLEKKVHDLARRNQLLENKIKADQIHYRRQAQIAQEQSDERVEEATCDLRAMAGDLKRHAPNSPILDFFLHYREKENLRGFHFNNAQRFSWQHAVNREELRRMNPQYFDLMRPVRT